MTSRGCVSGSTIVFDISLTYICVAFFGVLATNALVDTFSFQTRVTCGYVIALIVLLYVTVCDVWLQLWRDASYVTTLIAVAVVAFGCTGKICSRDLASFSALNEPNEL